VWLASLFLWAEAGLYRPDGAGYYVYLPSTWLDHDLLFFNEWQRLGLIRNGIPMFKSATETNHLGNHWTVGPALLWYPLFVAADGERAILPSLRSLPRDGFVFPYNLAVVTASAMAGLGVLLLGYRAARAWCSPGESAWAAIAVWFGTPLLWYSLRDAAMSHAVSAFGCALVVVLSLRLREKPAREAAFAVGLALGFAALVRIQNAALVLVPFLVLDREQRKLFLRSIGAFIAGGLLGVLPELVVSTILYGKPLGFVSIGVRAIGWDPWTHFWAAETLFSWYHGLFTWTPLALLAVIGLGALWRYDRRLASAALTTFAIQWIANASADRAFWSAMSFGARRFDNCAIFFLLGLAVLMKHRLMRVLAAACCVWTMLLFFVGRNVDLNAYQTFGELVRAIGPALSKGIGLLMFVPERLRWTAAASIAFCLLASAILLAAFLTLPARLRSTVTALYLAGMTAFLAWSGANGARRIDHYWPIIERSRAFAVVAGSEIGEQSLYENEARYLRRCGRIEEATRTEKELAALMQRRTAALRAAGIQAP